jgi:hypothetical protein
MREAHLESMHEQSCITDRKVQGNAEHAQAGFKFYERIPLFHRECMVIKGLKPISTCLPFRRPRMELRAPDVVSQLLNSVCPP